MIAALVTPPTWTSPASRAVGRVMLGEARLLVMKCVSTHLGAGVDPAAEVQGRRTDPCGAHGLRLESLTSCD